MSPGTQDPTPKPAAEQGASAPTDYYDWSIKFDHKLDKLTDKIEKLTESTHAIDKQVAVIKKETAEIRDLKNTVADLGKATTDLPTIRTNVDYLLKRVWLAIGALVIILALVQIGSAAFVYYIARSALPPPPINITLSPPDSDQSATESDPLP